MAMWRESYLRRAKVLTDSLSTIHGAEGVGEWTSDLLDREELVEQLATTSIELAFYLGHGRAYGWSGYRGLRFHHLSADQSVRPVGAIVSLSCNNLAFGRRLLEAGYVRSFVGSDQAVKVNPTFRLIDLCGRAITESKPATIGGLWRAVGQLAKESAYPTVHETWLQFQLLGDPHQSI